MTADLDELQSMDEYFAQDREVIDTGKPAVLPEPTFRAFDGKVLETQQLESLGVMGRTPRDAQTRAPAGERSARLGIPIVLTSGFTEQDVIDDLLTHDATAFMQKPFSAKDLVDKLCALMAR